MHLIFRPNVPHSAYNLVRKSSNCRIRMALQILPWFELNYYWNDNICTSQPRQHLFNLWWFVSAELVGVNCSFTLRLLGEYLSGSLYVLFVGSTASLDGVCVCDSHRDPYRWFMLLILMLVIIITMFYWNKKWKWVSANRLIQCRTQACLQRPDA